MSDLANSAKQIDIYTNSSCKVDRGNEEVAWRRASGASLKGPTKLTKGYAANGIGIILKAVDRIWEYFMFCKNIFPLFLIFCSSAHGYVPEFKTILSRTAENHGRGLYQIEQDVTFPNSPEPLVVHETWLIRDESNMRVTLEGQGPLKGVVQGTIVYDGGHKYFLDSSGSVRQTKLSDQWAEPIFNFRSSKNYRARLATLRVIPSDMLRDRPPFLKGPATYTPPHHIRLSRVGGVVNYGIGEPTPANSRLLPGLWIEQDQFLVRKIRFPDYSTVLADQYQRYDQNLWLPKVRSISWNNSAAQVQLMEVRSIGKGSPDQSLLLQPKSLSGRVSPLKLTDTAGVQDFYSRFR